MQSSGFTLHISKLHILHSLVADARFEWDHKSGNKMDRVEERTFGPVTTDVADVELRIKQAQKAVLNPGWVLTC